MTACFYIHGRRACYSRRTVQLVFVELFQRGEKRIKKLTSVLLTIVKRDPVEQRVSLATNDCPDCVDDVGRVRLSWDADGVLPNESMEVFVKTLSDCRGTSLLVLTRQFRAT